MLTIEQERERIIKFIGVMNVDRQHSYVITQNTYELLLKYDRRIFLLEIS